MAVEREGTRARRGGAREAAGRARGARRAPAIGSRLAARLLALAPVALLACTDGIFDLGDEPGDARAEPATGTVAQAATVPDDLRMQLAARRELAMDLPYNFQQIIGTHNAWNIRAPLGTNNQTLTVTQQLELGARALDIDVYRGPDGHLWLCHERCDNPFSDNIPIDGFFAEVKRWLDANPREILSFQVEAHDNLLGAGGEFQQKLAAYFGSRWLKQSERATFFPSWEARSWPTPRELLAGCQGFGCSAAAGVTPRQLLVASFYAFDAAARLGDHDVTKALFHAHDFGKDSNLDASFPAKVGALRDRWCYAQSAGTLELFHEDLPHDADDPLMRGDMLAFDDDKAFAPFVSTDVICPDRGTGRFVGGLVDLPVTCFDLPSILACDANMVVMDRFDEALARASVRTWEAGSPSGANHCAQLEDSGRLVDRPCDQLAHFFCTYDHGTVPFISSRIDVWANGEAVCAAEQPGAHFRGPLKESQSERLARARGGAWVNLTDAASPGAWTVATNLSGAVQSSVLPPLLSAECPIADDTVDLAWSSGHADNTSLVLERSPHGANLWTTQSAAGPGPGMYRDQTLTPGQTYDYRVTATFGGITTYSNLVTVFAQRPVDRVDQLTAQAVVGSNAVHLRWNVSFPNNIDHYEIYRKDSLGGAYQTVAGSLDAQNRSTYDDLTVPPGKDLFYYSVVAVNGSCKGRAASSVASSPRPPGPLTATVVTPGQNRVRLTFTDNSFDEDRFVIYRQQDGGAIYEIAHVPSRRGSGSTVAYEDFPDGNATYTYRVAARHPLYGDSAQSTAVTATVTLGAVTRVLALGHDHAIRDGQGGEQLYRFDPVGSGVFDLTFLTRHTAVDSFGDVDIYVAANRIPTTEDYDCASTSTSLDEVCRFTFGNANWQLGYVPYYVLVRGYTGYGGAELVALENVLSPGQARPLWWGARNSAVLFTIEDQNLVSKIQLGALSAPYGDADLHEACGMVPFNDPGTSIIHDEEESSTSGSYVEQVSITPHDLPGWPTRCFVLVNGWTEYGGLQISATGAPPG